MQLTAVLYRLCETCKTAYYGIFMGYARMMPVFFRATFVRIGHGLGLRFCCTRCEVQIRTTRGKKKASASKFAPSRLTAATRGVPHARSKIVWYVYFRARIVFMKTDSSRLYFNSAFVRWNTWVPAAPSSACSNIGKSAQTGNRRPTVEVSTSTQPLARSTL